MISVYLQALIIVSFYSFEQQEEQLNSIESDMVSFFGRKNTNGAVIEESVDEKMCESHMSSSNFPHLLSNFSLFTCLILPLFPFLYHLPPTAASHHIMVHIYIMCPAVVPFFFAVICRIPLTNLQLFHHHE